MMSLPKSLHPRLVKPATTRPPSRWAYGDSPQSRGVDRVPPHLVIPPRPVEFIVRHRPRLRAMVPHINPARDAKSLRAGRLRKELQP